MNVKHEDVIKYKYILPMITHRKKYGNFCALNLERNLMLNEEMLDAK